MYIKPEGRRLRGTLEEKEVYVMDRFTAAGQSMNLPKVQLRQIGTGKEVKRSFNILHYYNIIHKYK